MAIDELMKGTVSSDNTALTTNDVYKKIVAEVKNMKKRNMKVSMMRIAVSADTEELLLTDEKFSNSSSTIGAELLREGVIGKIAGVPVKTNYLMDEDVEFVIYDKRFIQKYEIWKKEPSVEDIKDGKHIGSSALQGRQVGGLMVTNKLGVQIKKKNNLSDKVSIPNGETELYGKTVDELASNLEVQSDGKVTGTLNYVTGYTGFNSTVVEEQSGNYFPFSLEVTGTNMTFKKNGEVSKENIPFEKNNVFRITSKTDKFEVLVDNESVITFDFSEVELKTATKSRSKK